MRTDFSEFSYGYALTEEFMTNTSGSPVAAPIFPSLVQEGSPGGGYDVMLSLPGVPLFLQFKRPDYMVRGTAREISAYGLPITLPFYRMHIRSSYISRQHELLLELNKKHAHVFYVAPLFHDVSTLNKHYASNVVHQHSIFIRAISIGRLSDGTHHVAYNTRRRAWLCSEPREIEETTSSHGLMQTLAALLNERKEPFRERGLREIEAPNRVYLIFALQIRTDPVGDSPEVERFWRRAARHSSGKPGRKCKSATQLVVTTEVSVERHKSYAAVANLEGRFDPDVTPSTIDRPCNPPA